MNMSQQTNTSTMDGVIIPPELAVKAMRDSGYRNTAYALAELIDNSIQANATSVELICVEKVQKVNQRARQRIHKIGILDNGVGMTPETLRLALQFGNGTHLTDREGIGRFGMGLPNSSISQCRRVEVWTWQSGPDNAMHTYLDVDRIEERKMFRVPKPKHKALPKEWRKYSKDISTSGTLVLWTNVDHHRLSWRGASAILRHTELFVGRMYRKFINDGRVTIRLVAIVEGNEDPTEDSQVRVNDPLYLMSDSSTPAPFDNEAMFQKWGEEDEEFEIEIGSKKHSVKVRMSWAKETTVPEEPRSDRGDKPYWKARSEKLRCVDRSGREGVMFRPFLDKYIRTY